MHSFIQFRNWTHNAGTAVIVSFWALANTAMAAPLLITSTHPDASAAKLYVYGENFGSSPVVRFANIAVPVLLHADSMIAVSIPYGLLNNPGTYLVSVSRGSTPEENSAIGVTVGQQGPKGDVGPAGIQGSPGAKGDVGPVGLQGPKGDTGLTGTVGPKGDKGEKGDIGSVGARGEQGLKGDTGATGARGSSATAGAVLYGGSFLVGRGFANGCTTPNLVTGACSCPVGYSSQQVSLGGYYHYNPWDAHYVGFICEKLPSP